MIKRFLFLRFIPARAGNTWLLRKLRTPTAVHPRTRGEHVDQDQVFAVLRRFIPARAGNTKSHTMPCVLIAVHPRTRGEHADVLNDPAIDDGSSPHARGTLEHHPRQSVHSRFIPARAGNTRHERGRHATVAVHPRTRGEHEMQVPRTGENDGSSPHARGTLKQSLPRLPATRFIPARAGNTLLPTC